MVPITCIICYVPGYLLLLESDRDYAYPGLVPREKDEAVGPCGSYGCRTGHDELLVRIFVDSSLWTNYLSGEMVSNCLLMSYGVVEKNDHFIFELATDDEDDLMVSTDCDKEIQMELEGEYVGEKVHHNFVNLENQRTGMNFSIRQLSDFYVYECTRELQLETEKIIRSNCVTTTACLDSLMQTELRDKGSMISKKWLPNGLLKPAFPL
ncbi:hypothetical protein L6452_09144 [Arctium lappa]|uniref:Uncharacterized protein n=1 Tax=Arctium lappa TaxID=4217 RepID=A0ACB9DJN1_ARCLA|nr:hypothetical protein L6452_09144 [Arctium lappa]